MHVCMYRNIYMYVRVYTSVFMRNLENLKVLIIGKCRKNEI